MNIGSVIGALVLAGVLAAAGTPSAAAVPDVYPLAASGYIPDSVVASADGAIWLSAALLKPCSGNITCQTELLGTLRSNGIHEHDLGAVTLAGSLYGATPGPGPSIWVTDPLKAARIFNLSGKLVAAVRFGRQNGSGALSAPFIGPDGRMWFTQGSFGLGGGGVVAVDASYHVMSVAPCKQCFFFGGVDAADGDAWLLDPYLGGFYRVTPAGALKRFDFGKFVLETLLAGPNAKLWGMQDGNVAEYDLEGRRIAQYTPPVSVQSGLRTVGSNLAWADYGPSASGGSELDIVTLTVGGAATVARFTHVGACTSSAAQWFSSGPALGGDGALYVGVGCAPQQAPYTVGGLGYLVRIPK
jgi:hypothetical protein